MLLIALFVNVVYPTGGQESSYIVEPIYNLIIIDYIFLRRKRNAGVKFV